MGILWVKIPSFYKNCFTLEFPKLVDKQELTYPDILLQAGKKPLKYNEQFLIDSLNSLNKA